MSDSVKVVLADTCYVPFRTKNTSGTPTAPTGTPTGTVVDPSTPQVLSGASVTMTSASGTLGTGGYIASFAATGANGFAAGGQYALVLDFVVSGTTMSREVMIEVD